MLASGYCLRAHFSLFLYVGGPQRQERERKRTHYVEIILLQELNLEVKLHFFYHILGIEAITNTCQIKKKKSKMEAVSYGDQQDSGRAYRTRYIAAVA